MAHVELYLTRSLCVHRFAGTSQQLLGDPDVGVPIAALLSDETDQKHLRAAVEPLLDLQESFTTLNLVFHAPGAPNTELAPTADRSPLPVPHANPARAGFHAGSPVHLTCFVTLQLYETNDTNGDTNGDTIIKLTATEYSRQHRQELVHTEFEAWLVHNCVQQAVIAARPTGEIVFFNHHAQELYQWSEEEALARDVSIFASADSMQQQQEEMERMRTTGEHQKRLFKLRRKDQSTFMGYVTDAAIMNADHELEYMVGVSADQQELYNVLQELQVLNADLNAQVEARLKQLVATEHLVLEKAQQAAESEARSEAVLQTMSMLSHELRTPLQGIIGVTSMALLDRKSVTEVGTLVSVVASDKSEQGTISTHSVTLQSCPTDESYYQDKIYEDLITVQASSQLLLLLINNLLDVRKIESGMMETIDLQCVDLSAIVDECLQTLKPLASLSDIEFHVDRDFMGNQSRSRLVALGNPLRVQQVLINLVGNAIKYSSTSSTASVEQCSYLDVNIRRSTLARAQQEACRALCTSFDATKPSAINSSDDCPVLIVDVRDRGNGIPVDEADKVFAEFAMLERDAGKSKGFAQPTGSGLGLQLCTKLCANMKGCVWANNCDSDCDSDEMNIDTAGCMFSFYLECPSSEQEEAYINLQHGIGMEVSVERKQERDVLDGQRRFFPSHAEDIRVLVLDDVKINVRVISRMLTKLGVASTHVRGATSGVQALQMLREDDACDLILTDMQMPGMNGLEFTAMARELYADKRKQAPFIVLCSADYSSSLETQCNELGLEGLLRKPIAVADLSCFLENYEELCSQ